MQQNENTQEEVEEIVKSSEYSTISFIPSKMEYKCNIENNYTVRIKLEDIIKAYNSFTKEVVKKQHSNIYFVNYLYDTEFFYLHDLNKENPNIYIGTITADHMISHAMALISIIYP